MSFPKPRMLPRLLATAFLFATCLSLPAQDDTGQPPAGPPVPAPEGDSVEQEAMRSLDAALRDPSLDFDAAYDAAREAGVEDQMLFESRLTHLLQSGDLDRLYDLLPALEDARDQLEYGGHRLFPSASDFRGFTEAIHARRAYTELDPEGFETHAKTAYWHAPQWVERLGITGLIEAERAKEISALYLADLRVPLDEPIKTADGRTTTLSQMLEGKEAVLLDFWASWCVPCLRNFPDLQALADTLPEQGIFVAAVNIDREDQGASARRIRQEYQMKVPWLLDSTSNSLAALLRIDAIPHMVLLGTGGEVLFAGLPSDPELEQRIAAITGEPIDG